MTILHTCTASINLTWKCSTAQFMVVSWYGHVFYVTGSSLRWRHNDYDGVSNHQPDGCLLNRLSRRRSKKTSKLRVTGLCAGNSPGPVNSPHKGPVTRKMFPFDDVIMCVKVNLPHKWSVLCCLDVFCAVPWTSCWTNSLVTGGLRHNGAHVTPLKWYPITDIHSSVLLCIVVVTSWLLFDLCDLLTYTVQECIVLITWEPKYL